MSKFNAPIPENVSFEEVVTRRTDVLKDLLGHSGKGIYIEPPLNVDYGCNITVGDGFYANFK
jgi:hypothetical protein